MLLCNYLLDIFNSIKVRSSKIKDKDYIKFSFYLLNGDYIHILIDKKFFSDLELDLVNIEMSSLKQPEIDLQDKLAYKEIKENTNSIVLFSLSLFFFNKYYLNLDNYKNNFDLFYLNLEFQGIENTTIIIEDNFLHYSSETIKEDFEKEKEKIENLFDYKKRELEKIKDLMFFLQREEIKDDIKIKELKEKLETIETEILKKLEEKIKKNVIDFSKILEIEEDKEKEELEKEIKEREKKNLAELEEDIENIVSDFFLNVKKKEENIFIKQYIEVFKEISNLLIKLIKIDDMINFLTDKEKELKEKTIDIEKKKELIYKKMLTLNIIGDSVSTFFEGFENNKEEENVYINEFRKNNYMENRKQNKKILIKNIKDFEEELSNQEKIKIEEIEQEIEKNRLEELNEKIIKEKEKIIEIEKNRLEEEKYIEKFYMKEPKDFKDDIKTKIENFLKEMSAINKEKLRKLKISLDFWNKLPELITQRENYNQKAKEEIKKDLVKIEKKIIYFLEKLEIKKEDFSLEKNKKIYDDLNIFLKETKMMFPVSSFSYFSYDLLKNKSFFDESNDFFKDKNLCLITIIINQLEFHIFVNYKENENTLSEFNSIEIKDGEIILSKKELDSNFVFGFKIFSEEDGMKIFQENKEKIIKNISGAKKKTDLKKTTKRNFNFEKDPCIFYFIQMCMEITKEIIKKDCSDSEEETRFYFLDSIESPNRMNLKKMELKKNESKELMPKKAIFEEKIPEKGMFEEKKESIKENSKIILEKYTESNDVFLKNKLKLIKEIFFSITPNQELEINFNKTKYGFFITFSCLGLNNTQFLYDKRLKEISKLFFLNEDFINLIKFDKLSIRNKSIPNFKEKQENFILVLDEKDPEKTIKIMLDELIEIQKKGEYCLIEVFISKNGKEEKLNEKEKIEIFFVTEYIFLLLFIICFSAKEVTDTATKEIDEEFLGKNQATVFDFIKEIDDSLKTKSDIFFYKEKILDVSIEKSILEDLGKFLSSFEINKILIEKNEIVFHIKNKVLSFLYDEEAIEFELIIELKEELKIIETEKNISTAKTLRKIFFSLFVLEAIIEKRLKKKEKKISKEELKKIFEKLSFFESFRNDLVKKEKCSDLIDCDFFDFESLFHYNKRKYKEKIKEKFLNTFKEINELSFQMQNIKTLLKEYKKEFYYEFIDFFSTKDLEEIQMPYGVANISEKEQKDILLLILKKNLDTDKNLKKILTEIEKRIKRDKEILILYHILEKIKIEQIRIENFLKNKGYREEHNSDSIFSLFPELGNEFVSLENIFEKIKEKKTTFRIKEFLNLIKIEQKNFICDEVFFYLKNFKNTITKDHMDNIYSDSRTKELVWKTISNIEKEKNLEKLNLDDATKKHLNKLIIWIIKQQREEKRKLENPKQLEKKVKIVREVTSEKENKKRKENPQKKNLNKYLYLFLFLFLIFVFFFFYKFIL